MQNVEFKNVVRASRSWSVKCEQDVCAYAHATRSHYFIPSF